MCKNKIFLFLFTCLCVVQNTRGQTSYRYWFDDDASSAKEGTLSGNVFQQTLSTDALTGWFHTFRLQVRTAQRLQVPVIDETVTEGTTLDKLKMVDVYNETNWSPVITRNFVLTPLDLKGKKYRYWLDDNTESAVEGTMTSNAVEFTVPTTSLDGFFHTFHLQVCDPTGVWQPAISRPFAFAPKMGKKFRYWIDDNDADLIEGSTSTGIIELNVPAANLFGTVHQFTLQTCDANGNWNQTIKRIFAHVNGSYAGSQYRYWFDDNDADAVTDNMTGNIVDVTASAANLEGWLHAFHLQVKNPDGEWQPTMTQNVVLAPPSMTGGKYRYWIDADEASAVTGDITSKVISLNVNTDGLEGWLHTLNITWSDASGKWGSILSRPFVVVPDLYAVGSKYRYWFDENESDAIEGTLADHTIDFTADVADLDDGDHNIYIQVQNEEGKWDIIIAGTFTIDLLIKRLTLMATGRGEVRYGEDKLRDNDSTYNENKFAEAVITLVPDEDYGIESVIVNGSRNVKDSLVAQGDTAYTLTLGMDSTMAVAVNFEQTDYWKLGDVNNDGRISVADVAILVNYLVGGKPTTFVRKQADANADREINVADVTRIVDIILGAWERGKHAPRRAKATDMAVADDRLTGALTDEGLTFGFEPTTDFTAFQLTISLPEGVDASDVLLANPRKANHAVSRGRLEDGRLAIVVYSADNSPLRGLTGDLLTVRTSKPLTGNVTVDNIVFVTKQGEARKFAPLTLGAATGIASTHVEPTADSVTYDLSGRRLPGAPRRGIYIVGGKKIIVR